MLKIVSNIAVYITTMIKDMQIESYCCEGTQRGERIHSNIHVSCIMQGRKRKSMFKHGGDNIGRNIHPACGMYCAALCATPC